jgi:hypothetical protein
MSAVRIANQLQMMFTADGDVTYEAVERPIIAAGITSYDISRQVYSETTDITITLNPPYNPETGTTTLFDAHDTLAALAEAVTLFDSDESE